MSALAPVNGPAKMTMRDAFLKEVLAAMDGGEKIFFLSADFGAPALDLIRERHPDRFINVGIAEQNLITVTTGLGLEGFTVYAYAIAPFVTMRCYEQIRVNMAILSQLRPMNVNLIGVGAGFSYDVSGPTHHCLEDISIMRTLPNFKVISPCDWKTASELYSYTAKVTGPKYLRFDAKPQVQVHEKVTHEDVEAGFIEIKKGNDLCLISTGFFTHKALEVASRLEAKGAKVGVIDFITLKGFNPDKLVKALSKYKKVVSLEEGFVGKGGVDAAIGHLILTHHIPVDFHSLGLKDEYCFEIGSREYMHKHNKLDVDSIVQAVGA